MKRRGWIWAGFVGLTLAVAAIGTSWATVAWAQKTQSAANSSLVERVGTTGFIRVDAGSFTSLDARQKELAVRSAIGASGHRVMCPSARC